MKSFFFFFMIFLVLTAAIGAQSLQLKWESETLPQNLQIIEDIDNDGILEIIYRASETEYEILDASTYLLKYTLPADLNTIDYWFKSFGLSDINTMIDWNSDGVNDIINYSVNTAAGYLKVLDLNNNNNIIVELEDPNYVIWPQYLGDIDNDNTIELVIVKTTLDYDSWKLLIYSTGILTNSINENPVMLQNFNLEQNFPNPFNPVTQIQYTIATPGRYNLNIYSLNGELVKNVSLDHSVPGLFSYTWNGDNDDFKKVASGRYIYQLIGENFTSVKKMVLMK